MTRTAPIERFLQKTEMTYLGCWNWTGYLNTGGYGSLYTGEKPSVLSHRFSYEHFVGPIPDGLALDHLCRNKGCVNPFHLEPVTRAENTRRAFALQTHCKYGHEYTPENTHISVVGSRKCRQCNRERNWRRRGRAA